ncbi:MAG: hypothetical protein WBA74_05370 [Cyclobacteriaceae bacterium]
MSNIKTPGVYIQEISTLPASVAAVETAIPAFIGYTEFAGTQDDPFLLNVPTRITSLLEYIQYFGGPNAEDIGIDLHEIYEKIDDDNQNVFVSRTIKAKLAESAISDFKLFYSLQMFFANGGGPCYIVSVGDYSSGDAVKGTVEPKVGLLGGLTALEKSDEPTLLVFPDDMTISDYKSVYDAALAQCAKLQDRFTIMDLKVESKPSDDAKSFRDNGIGIDNLKYGAVYYPKLQTDLNYGFDETGITINHVSVNTTSGIIAPTDYQGKKLSKPDDNTGVKEDDPALYRAMITEINKLFVKMAPGGAIAGVYARVDSQRGVWKAPANVSLNRVIAPTVKVTALQQ